MVSTNLPTAVSRRYVIELGRLRIIPHVDICPGPLSFVGRLARPELASTRLERFAPAYASLKARLVGHEGDGGLSAE